MKTTFFWLIFFLFTLTAVCAVEPVNEGAEDIMLKGGKRGNVPFPHRRHQRAIEKCHTCHEYFPQEKGSIMRLKEQEKLKKKQVMNALCLDCHRARFKAGEPSGPRTCKKCHIR